MILRKNLKNSEIFCDAREELIRKKDPALIDELRFESYHEGLSAQIMHIGPYSAEGPTVEKIHNFIQEKGYQLRGKHHEIYLGDPRRAKPENLKTVIRQPFKKR